MINSNKITQSTDSIPDKAITFKEIMDVIDKLGSKEIGDEWSFYPEMEVYNNPDYINPVAITYRLIEREHFEQSAMKPIQKKKTKDYIEYGEIFTSEVEFVVWGRNYDEINSYREWFEKFVLKKKPELYEEGVLDFLFQVQEEDVVEEINNNYFSAQRIRYYLRHARTFKKPYERIAEIEAQLDNGIKSGMSKSTQNNLRKNRLNVKDDEDS